MNFPVARKTTPSKKPSNARILAGRKSKLDEIADWENFVADQQMGM